MISLKDSKSQNYDRKKLFIHRARGCRWGKAVVRSRVEHPAVSTQTQQQWSSTTAHQLLYITLKQNNCKRSWSTDSTYDSSEKNHGYIHHITVRSLNITTKNNCNKIRANITLHYKTTMANYYQNHLYQSLTHGQSPIVHSIHYKPQPVPLSQCTVLLDMNCRCCDGWASTSTLGTDLSVYVRLMAHMV